MKNPTEEQIRKRAREIYMRHRKPGRDLQNWLQAERELQAVDRKHLGENEAALVSAGRRDEYKKGF
jgi:Protein of unknown function (DUF2934)